MLIFEIHINEKRKQKKKKKKKKYLFYGCFLFDNENKLYIDNVNIRTN